MYFFLEAVPLTKRGFNGILIIVNR